MGMDGGILSRDGPSQDTEDSQRFLEPAHVLEQDPVARRPAVQASPRVE